MAFNDLLNPEEFAFGAEPFGRGYDPAELVGDSGAALKLELRYTRFLPESSLLGYTAYGFYDAGKVWRRHPIAQSAAESAAAAGLGVRLSFARGVTGFVELAQPLTHDVAAEGDRGARFFGGVAKWL